MLAKLHVLGLASAGVTLPIKIATLTHSFPNVYGFLNLLVRLQGKMCQ